jgi:hypothetical protein
MQQVYEHAGWAGEPERIEGWEKLEKRNKRGWSRRLDVGDLVVGKEKIVGAFEHPTRKISHDRLGLHRKVVS